MYRVLKNKGNNENITLENTDTKASIIIGKLSMRVLEILGKEDITFGSGDDDIKLKDEWEITISEDTAKELSSIALSMRKPKRDQSKKSEQIAEEPKENSQIDAMDVLLGLASYN